LTWQDELRRLDEELAAGRISADEYRVSRDRILAAAANPAAQKETGAPPTPAGESTQLIQPPGPPRPDATRTPESDRTQQVQPGWEVAGKESDADHTQVVPGPNYPPNMSPPGGFPSPGNPMGVQQIPPWQQEERLPPQWSGPDLPVATPWASGEFGASHGDEAWLKQGPEVFGRDRSRAGRIIAIVVSVVVLVGVAVGAYFIWGRGSNTPAAQTTTQQTPPTTTTSKPPDPMAIAPIAGNQEPKEVAKFTDVAALNYLTPDELTTYQAAGPTKAAVKITRMDNGSVAVVLVVQASSAAAARTAVTGLVEQQVKNKATKSADAPDNVQVTTFEGQFRAHYVHGNVIVRVEVKNADAAKASADLTTVLDAQLKASAADG
jgi:flagellar basal body-associated protein FliL